jgi:deoxyribonuclease (pyrimidine dimer)
LQPSTLSNSHLLAELRELPRVFSYVLKYGVPKDIPKSYTMGKGHVKFFTNKLNFLLSRWEELYFEWVAIRGYQYSLKTEDFINKYHLLFEQETLKGDIEYYPTAEEVAINIKRLQERDYDYYKEVTI